MEQLFSPCTRLHDRVESRDRLDGFSTTSGGISSTPLQERNLDVSTEASER
jgi:hypothetical protein